MEKIVLIGGGGHCKIVIDTLRLSNTYNIAGIVDPMLKRNKNILGVPVMGNDHSLPELYSQGVRSVFISIAGMDSKLRHQLYIKATEIGFIFPSIVHPCSYISGDTVLESGTFIGAHAVVQPGSKIGLCSIVNTSASVDHDCEIADFVHIAPGVNLAGNVNVGGGSCIGIGSSVIQNIVIGNNVIIGAGSTVIKDISDNTMAFGNPCMPKKINQNK